MVFSLLLWPTTKLMAKKNTRQMLAIFDGHADTAVQCGAHRPMECIHGFMQSH
jgi:hypothetical protein